MAEGRATRRWRPWALWGLTAALGLYALVGDEAERRPAPAPPAPTAPDGKIRVTDLDPIEAHPGEALSLRVSGLTLGSTPSVLLSNAEKSKLIAEILHQKGERLVVQIPRDFATGVAKVRVAQGEAQSKPFEFRVERVKRGKQVRNLLGGLALFVFGLRTLSQGLRSWAGDRVRKELGRMQDGSFLAVALGAGVGTVTQLTTTASGLIVGLLESRLVSLGAAIAVLIGAQLGASATVAILPLASAREGLVVLAIGVAWISFATDRHGVAFGNAVLGGGLLFYGLHLLRVGFEPMVSDPQVIPYLRYLQGGGLAAMVACGAAGVVLSALLQGPAPVFVLVLGLAQSTGALDLPHSLAVLSGTGLGAAIDTAAVSWSFGRDARRLALAHLLVGGLATVAILSTVPVWTWLADRVVSGDPGKIAYGKKALHPNLDEHLAVGFAAAQIAVAALAALCVPWLVAAARRVMPQSDERAPKLLLRRWPEAREGAAVVGHRILARVLHHQRVAVEGALQLCTVGDRAHQTASEHALADARAEIEEMFPSLVGQASEVEEGVVPLRRSATTVLQLQRSVEELLRLAERCVERNFNLDGESYKLVRKVHDLLLEGIAELIDTLGRDDAPDLEQARSREIMLNAGEAAGRQKLLGSADLEGGSVRSRLRVIELLDAYENVGNHLYRVYDSLTSDVDEAVA